MKIIDYLIRQVTKSEIINCLKEWILNPYRIVLKSQYIVFTKYQKMCESLIEMSLVL